MKKMAATRREIPLHIMLLPGVVIMLIYSYLPMLGIVISFQNYNPLLGVVKSKWVGFENFIYLTHLPNLLSVVRTTFFIAFLKVAAGLAVPVVFALLLNEFSKGLLKRSIQTFVYLPHFLSWVIVGGILIDVLSPSEGIINQLIVFLGFEPIFFLGDNHWFPFVVVAADVWKEFGFSAIIFLAALAGIDPNLYEAAIMDGANRWKQTIHVTLPGITYIVILMLTLSIGSVLNSSFEQVFNLYSPMVYQSGDIIDTMVFRVGMNDGQFSLATALGLIKSLVSFILLSASYLIGYRLTGYRVF